MWLIIVLFISLSWANEFCIEKIENETNEPYLSYALQKAVERALIENGHKLSCERGKKVYLRVKNFREIPIAYTPQQRVSSYNLTVNVEIEVDGEKITIGSTVPYSLLPTSYGDIPRRRAIDELIDKIYLRLLESFRR